MNLSVVLTSAAVSALVAGLFTFVSQLLERRASQREFLMKTATDWAVKHLEQALQLSKNNHVRVEVPALGWLAYDYHRQLLWLMKRGSLPPEGQQKYDAWIQQSSQGRGANTPSPERQQL